MSASAAASNACSSPSKARAFPCRALEPALIWLVSIGDAALAANFKLLADLRTAGFVCDMDATGRSAKAQFKLADREKATLCITVGENELAASTVVVKVLATGEQSTVPLLELRGRLTAATR